MPSSEDLYNILGVSRGASTDEIRKAYKDKAKVMHPDRGGNADDFKKIQEAHEILSDDNRRRNYDLTGSGAEMQSGMPFNMNGPPFNMGGIPGHFGMPGVMFDVGDMFAHIFGANISSAGNTNGNMSSSKQKQKRGPNKHHDFTLRLSEFYKGHEINLKFIQSRRCGSCNGSGADKTEQCSACSGVGAKTIMRQFGPGMHAQSRIICDTCKGEGTRVIKSCQSCNGKRVIDREKTIPVIIKPGMREGDTIVYPGECSDSIEYETPGDVVLTLKRCDTTGEDLNDYIWKGDDLTIRKEITFAESILGFTLILADHPNGKSPTLKWDGGPLIHGAVLKMPGGGMPRKNTSTGNYGNLFIQILVKPPQTIPWSNEDAIKLQSVLGSPALNINDQSISLVISSAKPLLDIPSD